MALLCVVATYNEEGLLTECVRSALEAGVDKVHVFDGAWRAGEGGPGFDGATQAASTDATAKVARAAGAVFHSRRELWPDQGVKRTAMFQRCGARRGDHVLVLDADERASGRFPELPEGHLNVLLRSVGPNDLPGARANFPRGDYSASPRPALRIFAWTPDLVCLCPGHYFTGRRRIEPYDGMESRLPLIEEVCIAHHANLRNRARLDAKRAYYALDHPVRRRRIPLGFAALRAGLPLTTTRGGRMAEKRIANTRIADRRIYGLDAGGRRVLVAAPGQTIPEGFEVEEPRRPQRRARKSAPRGRKS